MRDKVIGGQTTLRPPLGPSSAFPYSTFSSQFLGRGGQGILVWTRGHGIPLRTDIMLSVVKSSVSPSGSRKRLPLRLPVPRVLLPLPHTTEDPPPLHPYLGRPFCPRRARSAGYLPRGIHRSRDLRRVCPRYRPRLPVVQIHAWTRRKKSKLYGCWITTKNWFIGGILRRMSAGITMATFTSLRT